MGSATNTFETDLLELIFNNTDIANLGDAAGVQGSTAAGSLYICLFSSDPTDSGTVTGEGGYTGYARVAVARTASGWTVSSNTADNTAAITFAECTAGSATMTHFGIALAGTASVTDLIFHGQLDSSLAVSTGIIPEFTIGSLDVTLD